MKRQIYFSISVFILILTTQFIYAQAPNPGQYSQAVYNVIEERGYLVPMRDGILLSVDVYRPESQDKFPGILTITPYDYVGPRERA